MVHRPASEQILSIFQWNCHGVRNKLAELKNYINKNSPDVICLQETLLKQTHTISIPNYTIVRQDRPTVTMEGRQKAGGGTLIAVKTSIPFIRIKLPDNIEHTAVSILLQTYSNSPDQRKKYLHIYNTYFAIPNIIDLDFANDIIDSTDVKAIVLGDFNAHSTYWKAEKNDINGKLLTAYIIDHNLHLTSPNQPTYIAATKSLLDLVLVSDKIALATVTTIHTDCMGSDHLPVLTTINQPPHYDNNIINRYNINRANWNDFKTVSQSSFQSLPVTNDTEQNYNNFITQVNSIADQTIPKTKNSRIKISVPYWTDKCKEAVKHRKTALKNSRTTNKLKDFIAYKECRAKATKTIKAEQKAHWESYCDSLTDHTKLSSVWKMAKKMAGKKATTSVPNLKVFGNTAVTNLEKAEALAAHFSSVSSEKNYPETFMRRKHKFEARYAHKEPYFYQQTDYLNDTFDYHELTSAITSAKKGSAPGADNICYEFLKHLSATACRYLLNIYNDLWKTKTFINEWRNSIVIPILKTGEDPTNPNSYRPIALTSVLCKIFERLVTNRLTYYVEKERLLNPSQTGFRKNRNTINQLIRLHDDAYKSVNTKSITRAIFLDFSKAFDMLWTEGLLYKLKQLKLHGNIYHFIRNFLTDRTLQVRLGTSLSKSYPVINGVPQGSVISPLLFILFANDFPTANVHQIQTSLFADDSAIWKSGRNLAYITTKLQQQLKKITSWCKKWGFKININKTADLTFTKRAYKLQNIPPLFLNHQQLKRTTSAKFLGIIFDNKLNFNEHMKYVTKKVNLSLNLLRSLTKTTWGASKSVLLVLYKALVKSRFAYGSELFYSASKKTLAQLDTIQFKALKTICNAAPATSLMALQNECGEPPLHLQRLQILVRHAVRIKMVIDNPAKSILQVSWHDKYQTSKTSTISQQLEEFMPIINTYNDAPIITDTPPWMFTPIVTNTGLVEHIDKKATDPLQSKAISLKYYEPYNDFIPAYTDGSKLDNNQTGIGIYFPNSNYSALKPLHSTYTIFQAEMEAIYRALEYIKHIRSQEPHSHSQDYVIYSDSLSAIKAIENYQIRPLTKQIVNLLESHQSLKNTNANIVIAWIPSHVNIAGNEMADSLAKKAANCDSDDLIPIHSLQNVHLQIKYKILNLWQQFYNNSSRAKYYKQIEPNVSFQLKYKAKNKKKEGIVTRLRLGKTYLNYDLHRLKRHNTGFCDYCPGTFETIDHFLLQCSFHEITSELENPTIQTIFSDPITLDQVYNNLLKYEREL